MISSSSPSRTFFFFWILVLRARGTLTYVHDIRKSTSDRLGVSFIGEDNIRNGGPVPSRSENGKRLVDYTNSEKEMSHGSEKSLRHFLHNGGTK